MAALQDAFQIHSICSNCLGIIKNIAVSEMLMRLLNIFCLNTAGQLWGDEEM